MESLIEWQSLDHHSTQKTADWYWILAIVTIAGSILSFYFGNILFGIFILIGALAVGLISARKPKEIKVAVTHQGIVMGNYQYPFVSYRSFWIEDDHMHGSRILLHPSNSLLPLLSIPVSDEIDLDHLRDIINDYLDEEFLRESAIHRLFDRLGI